MKQDPQCRQKVSREHLHYCTLDVKPRHENLHHLFSWLEVGVLLQFVATKFQKNIPETTVAAGNTAVCAEHGVKMRSLCLCHVQICWSLHQNQKPFLSWKGFISVYSKTNDFLGQRKNHRSCGFVVSTASFHISYHISVSARTERPTNC